MVTTREQALEVAAKVRAGLEKVYGERLRGVYLYGSAARDELHEDSDSDYRPVIRVADEQAQEVLGWAREFVGVCRKLCK
jgi:predicted nucleotidyltransferase